MRKIVSDTGALITLEKMQGGFEFIRRLYDQIVVPQGVLDELTFHFPNPQAYLEKFKIEDLIEIKREFPTIQARDLADLDKGEIEAISLAKALGLELLIEEADGRRIAQTVGLNVSGVAGQILKAYREKIISQAEALTKLHEIFTKNRLDRLTFQNLESEVRGQSRLR